MVGREFLIQRLNAATIPKIQIKALRGIANSGFVPEFDTAVSYLKDSYVQKNELKIKRWSRAKKEALIDGDYNRLSLLAGRSKLSRAALRQSSG